MMFDELNVFSRKIESSLVNPETMVSIKAGDLMKLNSEIERLRGALSEVVDQRLVKAKEIERLTRVEKELVNEIERLRAEQDRMQWVSVKEKLPNEYSRVLTWQSGRIYPASFATIDGHPYFESGIARIFPTHWMPLLPPPEDAE